MRWLTAAIAAGLGIMSSTASANQLTNPGFETDNASAGDVAGASGWGQFNFAFTTKSVTPHSGTQELKVFGPFFIGGGSGVTQAVPASPGQSFSASAWLRDDSSDPMLGSNFAQVQLQYLDSSNNVIVTDSSPNFTALDPINTWEKESASGIAPAGTAKAQIVLVHVQINNPVTGGSVFFDDASLDLVPEPGSLALLGIGGLLAARRRVRSA